MKRGTPEHPKLLDLAEEMHRYLAEQGIDLPFDAVHSLACGYYERMLHYTARYAPDGGIGKHSDSRIARAIGWTWDAEWIVCAFSRVHLLDTSNTCRFFVHDWDEHSDDAVHLALARKIAVFANGKLPRLTRLGRKERSQIERQYRDKFGPDCVKSLCVSETHLVATKSTQETHGVATKNALPSQCQSQCQSQCPPKAKAIPGPRPKPIPADEDSLSHSPEDALTDDGQNTAPSEPPFPLDGVDLDRAATRAADLARRVPPANLTNAKTLCRLAIAEQTTLSESFLADALEALRHNRSRNGPQAHFWAICASKAREELGIDLRSFLRRIPVPSELLAEVRPRVEADTS